LSFERTKALLCECFQELQHGSEITSLLLKKWKLQEVLYERRHCIFSHFFFLFNIEVEGTWGNMKRGSNLDNFLMQSV
jgi:hypothetical protein